MSKTGPLNVPFKPLKKRYAEDNVTTPGDPSVEDFYAPEELQHPEAKFNPATGRRVIPGTHGGPGGVPGQYGKTWTPGIEDGAGGPAWQTPMGPAEVQTHDAILEDAAPGLQRGANGRPPKTPSQAARGTGGKRPAGPNTGYGLAKKLSFLPEHLRPINDGYLEPDYESRLWDAVNKGDITQEQYVKARALTRDYFDRSVTGTATAAFRSGEKATEHDAQLGVKNLEAESLKMAEISRHQSNLVAKLEKSGAIAQSLEKTKQKAIDEQIGLIRSKIEKIENFDSSGDKQWGTAFASMFATIGMALGSAFSNGNVSPQNAGATIAGMAEARAQEMAQEIGGLKFGLNAENNILNILRADLKDDRAAQLVAEMRLMRIADVQVQAIGSNSSSEKAKMQAQHLSQSIQLHAKAKEDKLKAHITAQGEQAKMRRGGSIRKLKKNLSMLTQFGNYIPVDPAQMKGKRLATFEFGGEKMRGFADEELIKDYDLAMGAYKKTIQSLDTLERLHNEGIGGGISGANRALADASNMDMTLSAKEAGNVGAWDAGAQELLSPISIEIYGMLDNMPIVTDVSGELKNARMRAEQFRQRAESAVMGRVQPGFEKFYVDPETGQGKLMYAIAPESGARSKFQMQGADATNKALPSGSFSPGQVK